MTMESPSSIFLYTHIYLVGPYSYNLSVHDYLTGIHLSPSYGMCYSAVISSRVAFLVVFGSYRGCLCCYLCDEPLSQLRDHTLFGHYDRGIRLAVTMMPGVTRPLTF